MSSSSYYKKTSGTEILHLLIGTIIISLVIGSFFFDLVSLFTNFPIDLQQLFFFGLVAVLAAPAFILHELAHKFVAQKYGFWGEFRLVSFGVLITLISIISPIKLAGPGAVMIAGDINEEETGKISMAGLLQLNNKIIALIGVFLLLVPYLPFTINNQSFLIILAQLNALLAVFNLLPFSVLDGKKIINWDIGIWLIGIALSGSLWIILLFFNFEPLIWVLIGIVVLIIAGITYWKVYQLA